MEQEKRVSLFQRGENLERLLQDLNAVLEPVNQQLLTHKANTECSFPIVLVFGAPRSGTTLFMQWLATTGLCAYPSNLLSRFYGAPLIGAKIQLLLTDSRFAFRDELFDLQVSMGFDSTNGKTRGAMSPNEFWYFWRRFGFNEDYTFLPDDELRSALLSGSFRAELLHLAQTFDKPFALKAMIANQNINLLREVLEQSIFVWIRREPEYNIQSLLEARRRQHGSLDEWYSFRIREFDELVSLEPHWSVAGQIYYTNKAIADSFKLLPDSRKLTVDYEEFCRDPCRCYESLKVLLDKQGMSDNTNYSGPQKFTDTNQWHIPEYTQEEVKKAHAAFYI